MSFEKYESAMVTSESTKVTMDIASAIPAAAVLENRNTKAPITERNANRQTTPRAAFVILGFLIIPIIYPP